MYLEFHFRLQVMHNKTVSNMLSMFLKILLKIITVYKSVDGAASLRVASSTRGSLKQTICTNYNARTTRDAISFLLPMQNHCSHLNNYGLMIQCCIKFKVMINNCFKIKYQVGLYYTTIISFVSVSMQ